MMKGDNYMKTYKKKLKLKESVKLGLVWISCAIVLIATLTWYSNNRLPKLEDNNNSDYMVEVNFTR